MSFSINTNVNSLQAQNYLRTSSDFQGKTINRVTSGLRIVQSGDDAAGLAIANGYRSDEAVLTQGVRNANDGLSQLQIADGGLNNISQLLDRARTLATQSASGTFTGDRTVLNSEFQNVVGEIDRQAQAIGLNTGGTFAKSLSVFIGGGKGATAAGAISNGSVGLDLSQSSVDAKSLGLKGVQSIGKIGTDIGTGSAATSVATIVGNLANTSSEATSGSTTFEFRGPGFGDSSAVKVSVNLAGVTDTSTLVNAINSAITSAGSGGTQAATAFKNAGITAGVNVDSNGKSQLTFNSSSAAFQVQAGDKTANALLGNFGPQNASLASSGKYATLDTTGPNNTLSFKFDGSSTVTSVTLSSNTATSKGSIVSQLNANTTFAASATATLNSKNQIVISSNKNNSTSAVTVVSNGASDALGFTNGTNVVAAANDPSTGADVTTSVYGGSAAAAGSITFGATGAGTIQLRLTGSSLTTPVDLTLTTTAAETVQTAVTQLQSQVANNAALKSAGITLSNTSLDGTNGLLFTSNSGEQFHVDVTGDATNKLGFGSLQAGDNGQFDYTTKTATTAYQGDPTPANNPNTLPVATGTADFEFSINGAASNSTATGAATKLSVDLTGGDATTATAKGSAALTGNFAINASNNQLKIKIDGTAYNITLANSGNSSLSAVAANINSAIGSAGKAIVDSSGKLEISSATKGAAGSVEILAGNGNSANTLLGLTAAVNYGTSRSGGDLANNLNQQFASSSILSGAGLQASFSGGKLSITSNNGTNFRLNSYTDSATPTTSAQALSTNAGGTRGSLTGTALSEPITVAGGSNVFNVQVDGGVSTAITVAAGTYASVSALATAINNGGLTAAGGTATADSGGHLVITSTTANSGSASTLKVVAGGTGLATLGLSGVAGTTGTGVDNVTTAATAGTVTSTALVSGSIDTTGAGANSLTIAVDGGAAQTIALASSATNTLASLRDQINSQLTGASVSVSGATLVFTSNTTGAASTFAVTGGAGATALGLTNAAVAGNAATNTNTFATVTGASDKLSIAVDGGTAQTVTLSGGGAQTAASVVSDINSQLTGATASVDNSGHIKITSNSTGAGSSVAFNTIANSAYSVLGLSTTTAVHGADANVGFGAVGVTFGGNSVSTAPTSGAQVDSGGASQSTAINFSSIQYGSNSQAISITANDNAGSTQSVSVTLANNATSRTGRSIDEALSAINTSLQQSNNATLQNIVAVKDDSSGTEQIRFLSTDSNFKVSIGTNGDTSGLSTTAADGITKVQGNTISSLLAAGGGTADISTQSSAAAAVSALSNAVSSLGKAQAVVGRGENQFTYAVNLAQSQLTNYATAESRVRDADLAAESANLTKAQILIQAGVAALAQANSGPQQVLSLLRG